MKLIELTKGMFAKVDDADFGRLIRHRWCAAESNGIFYASAWVSGKRIRMHQLLVPGAPRVDHRDRDSLNYCRENLRPCTQQENMQNRSPAKKNKTSYKGVSWCPERRKFMACICLSGRTKNLGRYLTAVEAARAYDRSAQEHYGEFAFLNFPENTANKNTKTQLH